MRPAAILPPRRAERSKRSDVARRQPKPQTKRRGATARCAHGAGVAWDGERGLRGKGEGVEVAEEGELREVPGEREEIASAGRKRRPRNDVRRCRSCRPSR